MHGCWYIREPRLRAIGRFRIPGTGLRILCQWHLDSAFFELYSGFPTAPPPHTKKILPAWLKAYFLLLRKAPAQHFRPALYWSRIVAKRASNCL